MSPVWSAGHRHDYARRPGPRGQLDVEVCLFDTGLCGSVYRGILCRDTHSAPAAHGDPHSAARSARPYGRRGGEHREMAPGPERGSQPLCDNRIGLRPRLTLASGQGDGAIYNGNRPRGMGGVYPKLSRSTTWKLTNTITTKYSTTPRRANTSMDSRRTSTHISSPKVSMRMW